MSQPISPNILMQNLNKNFPQIIGLLIQSYIKLDKLENEILQLIPEMEQKILKNEPGSSDNLKYIIINGLCIKLGKEHILGELVNNLFQMNCLTTYINQTNKQTPEMVQQMAKMVTSKNEDIFPSSPYVEELQTGGANPQFIFMFIASLFLTLLNNYSSVANSLTPIGPTTEVSLNINFGAGKIPKMKSANTGFLDTRNRTQIEQITQEFGTNINFPPLDEIFKSDNLTRIYGESFIDNMEKQIRPTLGFFQSMPKKEIFYGLLKENIVERVKYINDLVKTVHPTLEKMCSNYLANRDPLLPIPLYEIFNSEMAKNLEQLQRESQSIIEERGQALITQRLAEEQIPHKEATLVESLSSYLTWSTTSVPESVASGLTVREIDGIRDQIIEDANKEISDPAFVKSIETEVLKTSMSQTYQSIEEKEQEGRQNTNLQLYFTAVCKIKRPFYEFNGTTGELAIRNNPIRSLFHLKVLANNVLTNYNIILEQGISKITPTGDLIQDIPQDEIRLTNLKSLNEKSVAILEIITNFEEGLKSLLEEESSPAESIDDFFQNIAGFWINSKSFIQQATEQFPITNRNKQIELTRQEEAARSVIEETQRQHAIEMNQRVLEIQQNQQVNNVTKEEWENFNQYFGINVEQVLKTGTIAIDSLVNATADVGVNGFEAIKELGNAGISSISSISWGLLYTSIPIGLMAFFVLDFFYIGLTTSLLRRIKRNIDQPATSSIGTVGTVTTPASSFNILSTLPREEFIIRNHKSNYDRGLSQLRNTIRGGRVLNKKTIKNKKRRTKTRKQKNRYVKRITKKRRIRKRKYSKKH
jgi:hypothetical protein